MSGRFSLILLCLASLLISGCSKPPAPAPVVNVSVEPPPPSDAPVVASQPAVVQPAVTQPAPAVEPAKPVEIAETKPEPATIAEKAEKPEIPADPASKATVSPKEMLKLSGTGVVLITFFDALGEKGGFGSGCIIDNGLILTNYHVVANAVTAKVQPRGAKDELLGASVEVIGYRALDEKNDLAILVVDGLPENLHTFKVAETDQLEQYDRVFAIGHPDGLKFSTSPGFVNGFLKTSDLPEQLQGMLKNPETEWIQTDAVIAGGSSGGPLLNEAGEIVGINTLRVGTRAGLAVRAKHVGELIASLGSSTSPLPVPDSRVLVTREVAEIKRGYDLENRQFYMDMQQARTADPAELQKLIRKNNPAPDCIYRCVEIIKKHPGQAQSEDAIKLCGMIIATTNAKLLVGRDYLDDVFEEAAADAKILPPTVRILGSLSGVAYSPKLEKYLRSVMSGDASDDVKAAAGTVLVAAMSTSETDGLQAEMLELANIVRDQFGEQQFQGKSVSDHLSPIIEGRDFEIGSMAAEIEGKDAEGKEFSLSEYRGKVVVLDFWADWCPHCRNMYPHEREMVERLKDQPFALLGVNGDEPARAKRTIAAGSVTWRSWLDGPSGPITQKYKIEGWPTIYVLDKEGRIRFKGLRGEELETAVNSLLNSTPFLAANNIVASSTEWKYQAVKNADDLASWQQADFDDKAWAAGQAPFGYGEVKTKLEQAESGQRPLTTLFRHQFDRPAGDQPAAVLMTLKYRDGIAVTLNGKEVYRDRLTAKADFETPALSRAKDGQLEGITISIDSGLLQDKGNCLAVELHQFSAYSAQPVFELTLGSAPDLSALMTEATAAQQTEIAKLLEQAKGLPGAAEIIEKLQAHESHELKLRGAVAAALNELPIKVKKISEQEAQQALVQELVALNQQAWEEVSRDDLSPSQYAEGLRKARAAYTLLKLAPAQYQPWLDIIVNTYGVALYRNGQYDKAQKIIKESLTKKGENPVDTAYLSMILKRLGKADEADQQRQNLTKLLTGDIWKHDHSGREAQKEVERTLAN